MTPQSFRDNELIETHSIIHPYWVRTPMIKVLTDWEEFFGQPIMTPDKVSNAIVKQILSQNSGQVLLPGHLAIASLVRAMPTWIQERVRSRESAKFKYMREQQERMEREEREHQKA